MAAPRAERPARRRRRPVGAAPPGAGRRGAERERLRVGAELHRVARAGLRRGQREARAAALVRDPRRHARAAAQLHVCRTVCRRAERRAIAVGEEGNPEVVRYLNRLSDLLFILSRAANAPDGASDGGSEPLWEPGAHGADAGARAPEPRRGARAGRPARGRWRAAPRRPAPSTAPPPGSRRARRWACARRGSAATQPTAAANSAPSAATERPQARRRDEHGAERERERGGRVAARPRGRRRCGRARRCTCGWASSGLSISAVSGASAITSATATRHARALARQRDSDERDAPDDEQQRVEQVQQDVRRRSRRAGGSSSVKSLQQRARP